MPAAVGTVASGGPPLLNAPAPALENGYMESLLKKGTDAFGDLRRCVELSGEPCEGNVMYTFNSWQPEREMEAKRKNLVALARALPQRESDGARVPQILEIGFNAGHSVCLMLLAHPCARVVAFDLCEHAYSRPCAEALRRRFGADRLELYAGPSEESLPAYRKAHPEAVFDLLHVDGGHQYRTALTDMENCLLLARSPPGPRSLVVLDDTDITGIDAAWQDFAASGRVLECASIHTCGQFKHSIGEMLRGGIDGAGICGTCGASCAPHACGGCHAIRYCSEACARAHWRLHRTVCEGRRPPPLSFPALGELTPSVSLQPGLDGSLLASEDLAVGHTLFSEAPLSWQVEKEARSWLCARCGVPAQGRSRCASCEQAVLCAACAESPCKMCPELKITKGHVMPFTLLVLDLIRRRESRELPREALAPPAEVNEAHRRAVASVQKVGHFCSAVRWPDERAADVLAAAVLGRLDVGRTGQALGMGYYSKLARLRAAATDRDPAQGNVRVEVKRSPEHMFTVNAVVCKSVCAGSPVYISS